MESFTNYNTIYIITYNDDFHNCFMFLIKFKNSSAVSEYRTVELEI